MSRESERISPDASLTSLSILNTDSVNVVIEAKIPSVAATALNGSVIVGTSLARLYRMRPNVAFFVIQRLKTRRRVMKQDGLLTLNPVA